MIRARAKQAVGLDEGLQARAGQPDAVDVEAGRAGLQRANVIVHALEDPVHPLEDEVELVLVDGGELEREAVDVLPVLAHEAVGLQPAHQRGLVHAGIVRSAADLGARGEAEGRARLDLVDPAPGAHSVHDRPQEVIAGGLDRHAAPQLDPEDRLLAVVLHRDHARGGGAPVAPVEDLEADQPPRDDLPDRHRPLGRGDQGVIRLAGVGLRPLVGRAGPRQDAGIRIDVEVPLRGPGEPVGVVQAGVEPLRGVRGGDLGREHVADLVVEGPRIGGRVEVAVLLAPVHPAARQAMEDLPGVPLAAQDRPPFAVQQRLAVRRVLRHTRLPEVLLGQDVGRHRGPSGRHRDAFLAEHRRPVGILDLGDPLLELDPRVRTLAFLGEPTGDSHALLLRNAGRTSRPVLD